MKACRCGQCRAKHQRMCPLACPHCFRDLLEGACHYAEDHPEGRPYYKRKEARR